MSSGFWAAITTITAFLVLNLGGLPGLALEERNNSAVKIVGAPPRREQGHWREGFIVLPVAPPRRVELRWLN